ncbi:MAG: 5-(carboxyamino)imidazole ribonucleotide mutase [Planctomycetota bacterium]|nr:MAG: 5-(carboxyamino)imidazole ribonucleotide mutase [Planctomycetota bacterium]
MGSDSDLERLGGCIDTLKQLEIPCDVRVLSAHRTPDDLAAYVREVERDTAVFICAAGGAAHLAGVVAAHTLRPVLGIPMDNPPLGGLDALLATVQMPGGVPVGALGTGAGGPKNAALLAARILAVTDEHLRARLERYRDEQAEAVRAKDARVRKKLGGD